jgi:hypothetical protein
MEMPMPEDMKWRLPDCWTVKHSDGQQARIDVVQDGNTLVGTAYGGSGDPSAERTGTMSGSVHGDTLTMTIYWPDNAIVEYHGMVSGDGRVEGTLNRSDGASADWFGEQALAAWE